MKRKINIVLGVALIGLCAIVTGVALGGSTVSTRSFEQTRTSTDRGKLYGILDRESIRMLKGHNLVEFDLVEEKTHQRITVVYDNPMIALPANFPAASHATAIGQYDAGQHRFTADGVLTKCPSKYESEMDLATKELVNAWQSGQNATSPVNLMDRLRKVSAG